MNSIPRLLLVVLTTLAFIENACAQNRVRLAGKIRRDPGLDEAAKVERCLRVLRAELTDPARTMTGFGGAPVDTHYQRLQLSVDLINAVALCDPLKDRLPLPASDPAAPYLRAVVLGQGEPSLRAAVLMDWRRNLLGDDAGLKLSILRAFSQAPSPVAVVVVHDAELIRRATDPGRVTASQEALIRSVPSDLARSTCAGLDGTSHLDPGGCARWRYEFGAAIDRLLHVAVDEQESVEERRLATRCLVYVSARSRGKAERALNANAGRLSAQEVRDSRTMLRVLTLIDDMDHNGLRGILQAPHVSNPVKLWTLAHVARTEDPRHRALLDGLAFERGSQLDVAYNLARLWCECEVSRESRQALIDRALDWPAGFAPEDHGQMP